MIVYIDGGKELLGDVKPLWEKLNIHHMERSNKKSFYKKFTFETRIALFETKEIVRVVLAKDDAYDCFVGYCFSSVENEIGLLESIFINEEYRGKGIGRILVEDAVAWMEHHKASKKKLSVAYGNHEALGFYEKLGFFPKCYVLEKE